DLDAQIVTAGYHSAEVFGSLSRLLDREGRFAPLIEERMGFFNEARSKATAFEDCLVTATFTLYNHVNTLGHQFAVGNREAEALIAQIDAQVRDRVAAAGQVERSAAALRAAFPVLGLMTLMLDQDGSLTQAIRQVETRFAGGGSQATNDWEQLINALYRIVGRSQPLAAHSDHDVRDPVN